MLHKLQERRAALKAALEALVNVQDDKGETRAMNDAETADFDQKIAELREVDGRIEQLVEAEAREQRAAAAALAAGLPAQEKTPEPEVRTAGGAKVTDAPVYVKGGTSSYFKDLALRALDAPGAHDATDRLVRSSRAAADEKRALGNTNTTGGSGGEFAPPTWLVNEWINLLRPGRVTANLFTKAPVPANTSSVSIPKLLTGTAVALQSSQNTTLASSDPTTGFVSTGFATIGGKNVVSQQLLDQSAVAFDQLILSDLTSAYNAYFGAQIYLGAGTGANNNAVLNGLANATVLAANQTTLAASPTPAQFYSKANGMLSAFVTNRYDQPDVWIMHPRRWYWLMAQTDSQGRPLAVPSDVAVNPIAINGGDPVQGAAGRFLGLPVVIDPNVPTNLGAGTNQDEIFLLKTSDLWLYESEPQLETFRAPYAESLGVLFRLYNYAGTILNRLGSSIATMNGAGLAAPTF